MSMIFNAIIFNVAIVPLKTIWMVSQCIFFKREFSMRLKLYILKITTIILGVFLIKVFIYLSLVSRKFFSNVLNAS